MRASLADGVKPQERRSQVTVFSALCTPPLSLSRLYRKPYTDHADKFILYKQFNRKRAGRRLPRGRRMGLKQHEGRHEVGVEAGQHVDQGLAYLGGAGVDE